MDDGKLTVDAKLVRWKADTGHCDASDIGWRAGEWPFTFAVKGKTKTIDFVKLEAKLVASGEGTPMGWIYVGLGEEGSPAIMITVWNEIGWTYDELDREMCNRF